MHIDKGLNVIFVWITSFSVKILKIFILPLKILPILTNPKETTNFSLTTIK